MVGSCVVVQRRRCEEAGRSVILSSRERLFVEEEDADMVVRARAPALVRVQEDSCQGNVNPVNRLETVNTYVSSREFSECQDVRIGAPAGVLKSVKSESRLQ